MIAGLFSKKKKDKANPEKGLETIKNLNLQIDTLEKKLDFYEKQMNTLTAEAKAKLKAKDKNGAKKLLAKKTRINSQIKQLEGAQNMLEEQKGMLENSQMMMSMSEIGNSNISGQSGTTEQPINAPNAEQPQKEHLELLKVEFYKLKNQLITLTEKYNNLKNRVDMEKRSGTSVNKKTSK